MEAAKWKKLGICCNGDCNAYEHFSLSKAESTEPKSRERLSILRDIIDEYNRFLPVDRRTAINSAKMAAPLLYPVLKAKEHEECWALYLSGSNKFIARRLISSGSNSATILDVQAILRGALEANCRNIIISHNHPGGDPRPSTADISETQKITMAAKYLDLKVLDHIIICDTSYYSFTEENTVEFNESDLVGSTLSTINQ